MENITNLDIRIFYKISKKYRLSDLKKIIDLIDNKQKLLEQFSLNEYEIKCLNKVKKFYGIGIMNKILNDINNLENNIQIGGAKSYKLTKNKKLLSPRSSKKSLSPKLKSLSPKLKSLSPKLKSLSPKLKSTLISTGKFIRDNKDQFIQVAPIITNIAASSLQGTKYGNIANQVNNVANMAVEANDTYNVHAKNPQNTSTQISGILNAAPVLTNFAANSLQNTKYKNASNFANNMNKTTHLVNGIVSNNPKLLANVPKNKNQLLKTLLNPELISQGVDTAIKVLPDVVNTAGNVARLAGGGKKMYKLVNMNGGFEYELNNTFMQQNDENNSTEIISIPMDSIESEYEPNDNEQVIDEQNFDEQVIDEQNFDEQVIDEQNFDEQVIDEQNFDEQVIDEQNFNEQAMYEQNNDEQAMYEQNNDEQAMYEQNNDEQAIYEQNYDESQNDNNEQNTEIISIPMNMTSDNINDISTETIVSDSDDNRQEINNSLINNNNYEIVQDNMINNQEIIQNNNRMLQNNIASTGVYNKSYRKISQQIKNNIPYKIQIKLQNDEDPLHVTLPFTNEFEI
jgi:hypothetical protein